MRLSDISPPCYRLQMTKDNKYRVGYGPRQIPVWLRREEALVLTGLDEYPMVGNRYEIHGEQWRGCKGE